MNTSVHTVRFLAAIQIQMLGTRSCLRNLIAYITLKKYCIFQSSKQSVKVGIKNQYQKVTSQILSFYQSQLTGSKLL